MNNKFRAYDKRRNQMCTVVVIDWGEPPIITSAHLIPVGKEEAECYKVYPENDYADQIEFLPYTELKDSLGNEIYKDDWLLIWEISHGRHIRKNPYQMPTKEPTADVIKIEKYMALVKWDEGCWIVSEPSKHFIKGNGIAGCDMQLGALNIKSGSPITHCMVVGNKNSDPDALHRFYVNAEYEKGWLKRHGKKD